MTLQDINYNAFKTLRHLIGTPEDFDTEYNLCNVLLAVAQDWRELRKKIKKRQVVRDVIEAATSFWHSCKYNNVPGGYQIERALPAATYDEWLRDDEPLGRKLYFIADEWRRCGYYLKEGHKAEGHFNVAALAIKRTELID